MKKRPEHFNIGTISVNEDGEFGVTWWGEHAEQGGISFTNGSSFSTDLKMLLSFVASNMEKCVDIYTKELKERRAKENA